MKTIKRGDRACHLLPVALLLGLSGCATVKTKSVEPAEPTTGLVYYLPVRSFDIDVKYVVTNCAADPAGKPVMSWEVEPVVAAQLLADRRRAFSIYDGLNGRALKALNFEITEYENGTLKAINATADDRTAETATNVVSGALKIALGMTGTGLFSGGKAPANKNVSISDLDGKPAHDDPIIAKVRTACGDKFTDALVSVRKLNLQMDAASEATEAKSKLSAAASNAEKAVVDARAGVKAAKETAGVEDLARANAQLADAVQRAIAAQAKLDAFPASAPTTSLQARVAAIVLRDLTFNASTNFVPNEYEFAKSFSIIYPKAALDDLGVNGAPDLVATVTFDLQSAKQDSVDSGLAAKKLDLAGKSTDGIWLRTPAMGLMAVCAGSCGGDRTKRLSKLFSVPQWGQVSVLPLKSMAFSKSTIKLTVAPDGAVTSLFFDTTAPAERASGAFATAGQSYLDYVGARRDLKAKLAAAKSQSEKDEIQQQIDVVDLQAKLATAKADVTGDQKRRLDDLDFQIQEIQKQQKLLEESKKLETMRNGAVATTP